jgi:hypothetical protein
MLWYSANLAAKQQTEAGLPVVAMERLATLPFAKENDYSKTLGNVFEVWKIKSPTDAPPGCRPPEIRRTVRFSGGDGRPFVP